MVSKVSEIVESYILSNHSRIDKDWYIMVVVLNRWSTESGEVLYVTLQSVTEI